MPIGLGKILDCTLRDGSYSVDFQFSADDTAQVVKRLSESEIPYIEIGHGLGLGASDKGLGTSAATDEEYMQAAAKAITGHSGWGVFCIPGIASLQHVEMASEHGAHFIRIGTNPENYKDAEPFIDCAKRMGMMVCANVMKTYTVSEEDFATISRDVANYGADLTYLVDSAGGMFPEEVGKYVTAVKEVAPEIEVGFHGHNNLGLGVANSLAALNAGASVVDTSIQGIGRGAGNTPTEQFLLCQAKYLGELHCDIIGLFELGESLIQPLLGSGGHSSIDMISGYSLFHSSYMPIIKEFATKYRVDPRLLIVEVCKETVTAAPNDLVEQAAIRLAEQGAKGKWSARYKQYVGRELDCVS